MVNDDQLSELERLEREATPGPWRAVTEEGFAIDDRGDRDPRKPWNVRGPDFVAQGDFALYCEADARFIAALRNAAPDLIAAASKEAELAAEVEELRDILGWLFDLQNGPPLPKYEANWTRTMERAARVLGRDGGEVGSSG